MRKETALAATLTLLLAFSSATLGATTASAATTGRYRTQPAETGQTLIDLGLSAVVSAGTTRLVSSNLVVGNAGELTAVSHLVYCRPAGSSRVTQRIVTGQNVTRGTKVTLLTRALVTAPAGSALTCRLYAILVNHASTRRYGTISVLAGTSLRVLTAPIRSSAETWQSPKALVNTAYATAPVLWTPVAGTTYLQALGDVNITTCYPRDFKGPCVGARSRRASSYANVGVQLVVQQLQASGAACRTFVSGPLSSTTITSEIHHRKLNKSIANVPVTSACTSRRFRAYVRVTTNTRANSVVVENNNQSVTALYVRP
jgi:hypothetical protein